MMNRTTSLLSCVAGVALVGAAAAAVAVQPASATDECLTKPKEGQAGKHWFYRIDRATKRQCWYLRDDDRAAASPARKPASQQDQAKLSSSAANAHAEFQTPAGQTRDDMKVASSTPTTSSAPASVFPSVVASAAPEPAASSEPSPDKIDSAAGDSALATRWPDASGTLQAAPEPAIRSSSYKLAAASVEPSPVESASPMSSAAAAGDTLSTGSLASASDDASRTRLFAFLGAVAVAGFSTSVLLARARARRQVRIQPVAARRTTAWPAEPELDRMHLPPVTNYYPSLETGREPPSRPMPQVSVVPRDDVRYDEQYEVEDLLTRYSGQGRRRS